MNARLYVPQDVEIAREHAIEEIHDCKAGVIVDAQGILPRDEESLHEQRREI